MLNWSEMGKIINEEDYLEIFEMNNPDECQDLVDWLGFNEEVEKL